MSENLVPQVPDPNGPPVLAYAGKNLVNRTGTIIKICVASGAVSFLGLILIPSLTPGRTMGALRSHRLTWEERQKEIAETQAQADVAEAPASPELEPPHE